VNSALNRRGNTFLASLASPIMVGDRIVIPAEAAIEGKIVDVRYGGRFNGRSALVLKVTRLAYNGRTYELRSSQYSKQGVSRTTHAAAAIGGGAGVGAIIGVILGGGKGAAIGAVIGAGAGTGVQAMSKAAQVQLPAKSTLNFRLETPLTVIPSSTLLKSAERRRGTVRHRVGDGWASYKLNVDPLQFAHHQSFWQERAQQVEQERLAILRYNYWAGEKVRRLSKRQIIGYMVEVSTVFPLLHPHALEQERLSWSPHSVSRKIHLYPPKPVAGAPNHELTPLPISLLAGHRANSAVHWLESGLSTGSISS
jgi:hypothetical protein